LTVAGKGSVGRPHIAKILYEKGYVSYPQEAFQRLIGRGGKAYVPRFKITPGEAISLIRKAEGIPVLAHPGLSGADHLILPLRREGLMGIEVFHPDHKINDESKYLKMAKEHKLIITGGSDFHGMMGGNRSALGSRFVSSNIWRELITAKKEIKNNGYLV
ncbi:MAG: phosphatase, partial [Dehalobacterium sp.]